MPLIDYSKSDKDNKDNNGMRVGYLLLYPDVFALALIYKCRCDGHGILPYDDVVKYLEKINEIIDNMDTFCRKPHFYHTYGLDTSELKYFHFHMLAEDEKGKEYLFINPSLNGCIEAISREIVIDTPLDIIKAACDPDALSLIGLKKSSNNHLENIKEDDGKNLKIIKEYKKYSIRTEH